MIRYNPIKEKLKDGKTVFGTFVKIHDPSVVEILGLLGFDFFVLDNEHVAMNRESITNIIRCAELTRIVPIIRIKGNIGSEILQALDSGALGIQVPQVNSSQDALNVVQAAKYSPLGKRGFAPTHRSARYGLMDPTEYIQQANENVMVICYCETMEAVKNIDDILEIEGIDVIFIGPMDLSMSMGITAQMQNPKLRHTIDFIINKTRKARKAVGIISTNGQEAKNWMEQGVQYITISSDQGMIISMGKRFLTELA